MLRPSAQREAEQILALALKLVGTNRVHHITDRLTITYTPATTAEISGDPNTLTIVRHSGGIHLTVLSAIWHDDGQPVFFATFIGAAWVSMVYRAVAMTPQSILPE